MTINSSGKVTNVKNIISSGNASYNNKVVDLLYDYRWQSAYDENFKKTNTEHYLQIIF